MKPNLVEPADERNLPVKLFCVFTLVQSLEYNYGLVTISDSMYKYVSLIWLKGHQKIEEVS